MCFPVRNCILKMNWKLLRRQKSLAILYKPNKQYTTENVISLAKMLLNLIQYS